MQCATDLVKLRDSVISRSRNLRKITAPITTPTGAMDRRALAYAAIELDNMVVVGLRQFTKSCLLRSRTASGSRIICTVRPKSTEEAAALIFKSVSPSGYVKAKSPLTIKEKDEIAVRDPKKTEKVLMDYSASNLSTFAIALSLNSDVFSETKVFRHFFAHRSKNTFESVQAFAANLAIFGVDMPEHLLLRGRPGTGVRFLDGWLADMENFFDLAT